MNNEKYIIVDLETTGHSPKEGDRMIQIAMVIMKDWVVEDTFTTFIHPGKPIPFYIQDLTKITDEDVKEALLFEAYAHEIYERMENGIFVAHNADFDLSFLQEEFKRAGLRPWKGKKIDTVELSKILFPMSLSYKLGDLASDLSIPLEHAHRADEDAMATALLLKKCWEELLNLPVKTIEQLHKKSFKLKSNISHLLFSALQQKRMKLENEQDYIHFRNIAIRTPEKFEFSEVEQSFDYPKTIEEKIKLFEEKMPTFEKREEQFQMMDAIWEKLERKEEIVIEAPTGMGKTIGYLLPSLIYAKKHRKKICISTYTSYLLEQLLANEFPKMEKILGTKIQVSLLKGMQNYIDLELFEQLIQQKEHSYDETLAMLQVLVWLSKTTTGDLNELNLSGGGKLSIDKVRKTERQKNPPFDFYERAVQESEHADVILTNHAMVLADLVRLDTIFNEIDGWIIDEAHQFVKAAIQRDQTIFSFTNWKYHFGQIGTPEKGLFYEFQRSALKHHRVSKGILQQLGKTIVQINEWFDETMQGICRSMQAQRSVYTNTKQTAFLQDLSFNQNLPKKFSTSLQTWIDLAEQASAQFRHHIDEISTEQTLLIEQWDLWVREFKIKLTEWDDIFIIENGSFTTWVEIDRRNIPGSIRIFKKPIKVQEIVQQFFQRIRGNAGIIWTSATLTVPKNERFITSQLGLDEKVPILQLRAPEDFYNGAKAYVVTDMPDIQGVSQNEYVESVAYAITQIVRRIEGRCFVLFTAQDMLKKTVDLIQESELLHDYVLFAQGVTSGSRMKLVKSFQKFNRSVLFGTSSFWEGVDVPGERLNAVIIVRLPFSSPEEPIFKAKTKMLSSEGFNAFTKLSLPEAIVRFKQGFGRLIRSSKDKGAFIVLDRRIETKSYGNEFIRALPDIQIEKQPLQHMVQDLEHWYNIKDEE